ncbi:Putative membrane protein [Tolypocladium paradoxum]|uniref:Glycerophosphocholine acyltransferase 1 n=1 Tax=Tolypocladium paradoxum TaxID=94208 RepID=A0A2S4KTG4_9HYPO|nr:Putative membrane protein [Tolypocladium paradoxum]
MDDEPASLPISAAGGERHAGPEPDISSPLSSSPPDVAILESPALSATIPKSPRLSRNPSFSGSSSYHDDWDPLPPLDRLTVLDLLDNFALPQQLEKLQKGISAQTDKVRRSRDAFKSRTQLARDRMVEEWRRRVPSADEQFDRYRKRMRQRVDKLGRQWNDTKAISLREKISFICGVMNIFISGYLIGGFPQYFHLWYTAQLVYFMPIRFFTYHRRGYHYFLADLCYFVNVLLSLSIWAFPSSKRLFTAAYCLAFGNNAVAIIMWRNSLVFHSFDKVTSLFIHIMPCATLHCIVHLFPPDQQKVRFPAIWTIKNSAPGSPTAYANVFSMLAWSTIPYAIWQLSYYFFITVRRREKIAAGRPTSFTWLRRSYSRTWIGRIVLSLPSSLQEPAFMMIQYSYAVLTMLPCPLWFVSRYASSAFLLVVFAWSIYNGSTYYIDVFGKRFQKELEAMKAEVLKWQSTPELMLHSPLMAPHTDGPPPQAAAGQLGQSVDLGAEVVNDKAVGNGTPRLHNSKTRSTSLDHIPLLDENIAATATVKATATGVDDGAKDVVRERRAGSGLDS